MPLCTCIYNSRYDCGLYFLKVNSYRCYCRLSWANSMVLFLSSLRLQCGNWLLLRYDLLYITATLVTIYHLPDISTTGSPLYEQVFNYRNFPVTLHCNTHDFRPSLRYCKMILWSFQGLSPLDTHHAELCLGPAGGL